ncbi:MAG: hypothetical protein ABII06_09910, partial [Pseudomonadota bacterium]
YPLPGMHPVRTCQACDAVHPGKGGSMVRSARDALSDRAVWFLVGLVVLCVLLVLVVVFRHDEEKPKSPQALAAAAFSRMFSVQEWKQGTGKQPFMYHPAGFQRPVWKPLPMRGADPRSQSRLQGGSLHWTPMNRGGGQP